MMAGSPPVLIAQRAGDVADQAAIAAELRLHGALERLADDRAGDDLLGLLEEAQGLGGAEAAIHQQT
jgi:hypothetical protein